MNMIGVIEGAIRSTNPDLPVPVELESEAARRILTALKASRDLADLVVISDGELDPTGKALAKEYVKALGEALGIDDYSIVDWVESGKEESKSKEDI